VGTKRTVTVDSLIEIIKNLKLIVLSCILSGLAHATEPNCNEKENPVDGSSTAGSCKDATGTAVQQNGQDCYYETTPAYTECIANTSGENTGKSCGGTDTNLKKTKYKGTCQRTSTAPASGYSCKSGVSQGTENWWVRVSDGLKTCS